MVTLKKRYTYDMIMEQIYELNKEYKGLLNCKEIGESHDGRKIVMVRMGMGNDVLFCTAGIHGRESTNPILLLKMIEEYGEAYRKGVLLNKWYDIRELLQKYSICFIPLVNPDGYEIAMSGFEAIQNPKLRQALRIKRIPAETWKYNARSVDINRNFPCRSYIRRHYYDRPGSEQETRALMRIFQQYPTVGYIDFHSRGQVIYYYRQSMPHTYNQHGRALAGHLQNLSKYSLGRQEEELPTAVSGGNSVHYFSETTDCPAITVETVSKDAKFPLDVLYQQDAYQEVRYIPLGILSQI